MPRTNNAHTVINMHTRAHSDVEGGAGCTIHGFVSQQELERVVYDSQGANA